jgi:hypothetical protein
MVITAMLLFERPFDIHRLRSLVLGRLCGEPAFRRLRQKVVQRGGAHVWEEDGAFDLARHVFEVAEVRAPETSAGLLEFIAGLASEPLPKGRPLWQLLVITFILYSTVQRHSDILYDMI